MSPMERKELWRWGIFAVVGIVILVWIYALEPALKALGWKP